MTYGRVAVVGGGLAGMAAAVALRERGLDVTLYEARARLGGRASSFCDPATGQLIDFCQHVSMGCCTNLADFCRRVGIGECFRRVRTLHFLAPDGRRYDVAASRWLPAPLHLAPALWRLRYLSLADRLGIARVMRRLVRWHTNDGDDGPTMARWLAKRGASPRAVQQFWGVVLTSALGETLDRVSVPAARKVFVDGFLASRDAYQLLIPALPLGNLYGERLAARLTELGVTLSLRTPVQRCDFSAEQSPGQPAAVLHFAHDRQAACDAVVLAVTWRQAAELITPSLLAAVPELQDAQRIEASPITGVHLWFDRPITALAHAVLVGRTSQWIFSPFAKAINATSEMEAGEPQAAFYYQVVISGSRELALATRAQILEIVCRDLREVFADAREARLVDSRVVTEKAAVFSASPGVERLRPSQRTAVARLVLAGDWTDTGWPSTMEGAVRSGYLAAEAILAALGRPEKILIPDAQRSLWTRWLVGGRPRLDRKL